MSAGLTKDGSVEGSNTAKLALTAAGATNLAASIHGSLKLDEILHGSRRTLGEQFVLGRLSFVQHRVNESTVTLYSIEDATGEKPIGKKVIPLETSRLKQCLNDQHKLIVHLSHSSEQDGVEREYLLHPEDLGAIYLPLVLGTRVKGALVIGLRGGDRLQEPQIDFLDYLASHLTLAVENSDVHYMERRHSRQLTMVSDIAKQAVMLEDLNEFLRAAAGLLREGLDYHVVQIWTLGLSEDRLTLRGHAHKAQEEPADTSVPEMVTQCQVSCLTLSNNNLTGGAGPDPNTGLCSQLVVPIRLRGKFLGVLSLGSKRLDAFPEDDVSVMEGVASLIASAFDNLQMFVHARQSNEYMQAILNSAKDLAILSTDVHGYVVTSNVGSQSVFHASPQEVLGKDILSLFSDSGFQRELTVFISKRKQTLERSKLEQATGSEKYYLDVIMQRVEDPEKRPVGFLAIVRDVSENVRLERTLETLSITDELTGLMNQRRFFTDLVSEIERCRRFNRTFSLCFFDLDGFKMFNDYEGHIRGDQALKETATLLRGHIRANLDMCYRYGGDEYTIIMPETSLRNAQIVAGRMRLDLQEHFEGNITASIGIAEYSNTVGAEEMLRKADRAMYNAKSLGGNRIVLAE